MTHGATTNRSTERAPWRADSGQRVLRRLENCFEIAFGRLRTGLFVVMERKWKRFLKITREGSGDSIEIVWACKRLVFYLCRLGWVTLINSRKLSCLINFKIKTWNNQFSRICVASQSNICRTGTLLDTYVFRKEMIDSPTQMQIQHRLARERKCDWRCMLALCV